MIVVSQEQVIRVLNHLQLIRAMEETFCAPYFMPDRHHHFYQAGSDENTLLLMPVWTKKYLGLKQAIVAPGNNQAGLPSVNAVYLLSDAKTGIPLAMIDGTSLTAIRTACTSALAAKYLARKDARILLILGGGNVARQLIYAHTSVRDYTKILVWTRRPAAFGAFSIIQSDMPDIPIEPVENLETAVREADVISCATPSTTPLIHGEWLREGQHLDLIGSFKMNMRETDDMAVAKCRLYADSPHGALYESGDLGIPLKKGIINENDFIGDIVQLCRNEISGRQSDHEITLYKSVGMAIEDLAAAMFVYKSIIGN